MVLIKQIAKQAQRLILLDSIKRYSARCLLVAVSVLGLCIGCWFLLAEYYFQQAKWAEQRAKASQINDFTIAHSFVDKTLAMRPDHVWALDFKASMIYRQWQTDRTNPALRHTLLDLYAHSDHIRKRWPLNAARQARVLAHDTVLSEAFFLAFDQVVEYGLHERYASTMLLRASLPNWYRLPDGYRADVITLMDAALLSKANSTLTLKQWLDRENLLSWFCGEIVQTPRAIEMCTR